MLATLSRRLFRRLFPAPLPPRRAEVLSRYVAELPSPATIASIFKDQWISRLPSEIGLAEGHCGLFDDARLHRFVAAVDVAGKSVLELGPLEAGHTTHLLRAGAARVTAIEANSLAFLKCLAIKEALGLHDARFLLGDFVEYLRQRRESFDVALASGVIYHMRNPVELIELLAHACRHVFVWTHYYDPAFRNRNPAEAEHLKEATTRTWKGFGHTAVRYEYDRALDSDAFCGGPAASSVWLPRADLLGAFEYFGLSQITILDDDQNHPHGNAIAFVASRPD